MGTGNTILYWYLAFGLFVLFTTSVFLGLMAVARRRRQRRYRTQSLDRDPSAE